MKCDEVQKRLSEWADHSVGDGDLIRSGPRADGEDSRHMGLRESPDEESVRDEERVRDEDRVRDENRVAVEQHLAKCESCRAEAAAMQSLSADLRAALSTSSEQQERVVAGFLKAVGNLESTTSAEGLVANGTRLNRDLQGEAGESPVAPDPQGRLEERGGAVRPAPNNSTLSERGWAFYAPLLLAASAGFLVAWLIFGVNGQTPNTAKSIRADADKTSPSVAPGNGANAARQSVKGQSVKGQGAGPAVVHSANPGQLATVNVSVGSVEAWTSSGREWEQLPEQDLFFCPSSSEIRTKKDAVCELEFADGSVLRLDESSQVKIGDANEIEVISGKVWCRAGANSALSVSSSQASATPPADNHLAAKMKWTATCAGSTCVVTSVKGSEVNVMASKGNIDFQCESQNSNIARGQMVRIVDGKILPSDGSFDPIAATRWIHAILKEKGPNDPELNELIRELLLKTGYSKANFMYEDEIRTLGQHAVLPLLEYLAADEFTAQLQGRRRAARLASDLAPSWAIPDLIERLGDDDSQVAAVCAEALFRLAGTDLNQPVEKWRDNQELRLEAQQQWRKWWQLKKAQMPKRPIPLRVSA
jgi:hypothetical protein